MLSDTVFRLYELAIGFSYSEAFVDLEKSKGILFVHLFACFGVVEVKDKD